MRTVSIYTHHYVPIITSGVGNTARLLAKSLVKKNCRVNVITTKCKEHKNLPSREIKNKENIYRIKVPSTERLYLSFIGPFFASKNKIKQDVIHAMDPRSAPFIRKNKSKLIVNISDYVTASVPLNPFKKYPWIVRNPRKRYIYNNFCNLIEHISYKRADKVIANSDFASERVSNHFKIPKNKMVTIKKGIDLNEFKEKKQKDVDLLVVGGNLESKGVEELIKTTYILKKEFKDIKIVLIGKSPKSYVCYLKKLIKKLNVERNVLILTSIGRKETIDYFLRTKIFVLLSRREALGQVLMEAMACKIPVVAAREGGIPEVVINNKTGFLVNPHNTKEVAEKISLLLNNKKLADSLGREGYKRVKKYFTSEIMAKKYIDVYKQLIG